MNSGSRPLSSNGFTTWLGVEQPYKILGIWLIDQWRQIGLDVEHWVEPTAPFYATLRGSGKEFGVSLDFNCQAVVNPIVDITKFLSSDRAAKLRSLPGSGARAILLEASLSFLGLGVQEPTPAWELMLHGGATQYAESAPWMAIFPGVAISLAEFAFNLFGDSLRDALDPRLRTL